MLDPRRWREWWARVPAECPGCARRVPGQGLCALCDAALAFDPARARCPVCVHPLVDGVCPDCRRQAPAYDRVVAAFDYAGLGRELVHDYKVRCQLALAAVLAHRLEQALRRAGGPLGPVDWIVPVPARRAALIDRGFSPPAEISRILARRLGLRHRLDLLARAREGPKQALLGRAERRLAPRGAYVCRLPSPGRWPARGPGPAGCTVAVVDDVLTTGATLHEIATVLKAAGVTRVEAWVLARSVDGASARA